ncbi:LysM peptidoglycan-binding domain-containing protein [Psychrobacter sp. 16-MNA-CIBAN-0192]|uniref:muramidase family protein n=1 Tax=Psychrobacter sp. 16-MNA-CIBAN-0192 TaxID=3140448 RepID=UPI00332319AD
MKKSATNVMQCAIATFSFKKNSALGGAALLMGALIFSPANAATQHLVESGETLSSIAIHYNVSQTALIDTNGLKVTDIMAGQLLQIPSKESAHNLHKVEIGDSLTGLSKKYNVDLVELARVNKLTPQSGLLIGSTLIIPSKKAIAVIPATEIKTSEEAESAPSLRSLEGSSNIAVTVPISAASAATSITTAVPVISKPTLMPVSATVKSPPKTSLAAASSVMTDSKKASTNTASTNTDNKKDINKNIKSHIVKYGETLTKIAELYQLDVNQLAQANDMKVTDTLYFGRSLMLLPADNSATKKAAVSSTSEKSAPLKTVAPIKYTVKAGDTLIGIATKYKTDFMTIANLSNIKHYLPLQVGQVLMVPNTPK